ncbi:MAG TPA: copper homeostasis protein CutC [Urbifossiella sp.]|jgi:copper homeostasis protein
MAEPQFVKKNILEAAITTATDARAAESAGADRLELCSVLEVGGVTPSLGTFLDVREAVRIPVYVLLRPRPGGFVYCNDEFATIRRDAEWFLNNGASGIVCGILDAEGRIDRARCVELAAMAKGNVVFHRAFDFLPDRFAALEELIDLGFERILTSGGAATAAEGAEKIARLMDRAAGRIEILPAGGIGPQNVEELIKITGCNQVHGSFRGPIVSEVSHGLAAQMGVSVRIEPERVREMRILLDQRGVDFV